MEFNKVMNNIYSNPSLDWIKDVDPKDVGNVRIMAWLQANIKIIEHVKFLNQYTFVLNEIKFLTLCAAIIPKHNPFKYLKWAKKKDMTDEWTAVFKKIQRFGEYGENDMVAVKKYLTPLIEKDKITWFKRLGFDKKVWQSHEMDFNDMKSGGERQGKKGLDLFM